MIREASQKEFGVPSEISSQIETVLESLGGRLLSNLEENCEINQTLKELKELKSQNDALLKLKISELENSYGDMTEFSKITQEIISLRTVMDNNYAIEKETEEKLKKNLHEKKALQEKILQVTNEKISAQSHNIKEAQDLAKQKSEKDSQIVALEQYILDMQQKLAEKVHSPN